MRKEYMRILEWIAKRDLGIETLKARRSDELDYHDCAVWQIRRALENAFFWGMIHDHVPLLRCPACGREHDIWCDRRGTICGTCFYAAPLSEFEATP